MHHLVNMFFGASKMLGLNEQKRSKLGIFAKFRPLKKTCLAFGLSSLCLLLLPDRAPEDPEKNIF